MGSRPARVMLWLMRITVGGLLVQMAAATAGWAPSPSAEIILGAAAVAAVVGAWSPTWTGGDGGDLRIAALLAMVATAGSAALGGLGALEASVAVVSVVAFVVADRADRLRELPWGRILMVVGILLVAVALVRIATVERILGHDEAAYALRARAWIAGTPTTGFRVSKPIGLPVLIMPLVAVTQDEQTLRLVGVVFAVTAVMLVGFLAHRVGGGWATWAAAGTTVAAVEFMRRGAELLTDVPASALLLGVVAVLWHQLEERDGPGWGLALGAPLAAGAFYLRYQSALALAGLAVAVVVLWRRKLGSRVVATTLMFAVVLVVPHVVYAQAVTGSAFGLLTPSAASTVRAYVGQGLVDYVQMFPLALYGPAGAVLMVAAALGGLVRLVRREAGTTARFEALAFLTAFSVVVPVGLVSHGEPRFVFFPVMLLVVAGAAELVAFVGLRPRRFRAAVALGLSVLLAGLVTTTTSRLVRSRHLIAEQGRVVAEAAAAIASDAAGRSCGVLTSTEPQITWYTGCSTRGFGDVPRPGAERRLPGEVRYLLLYEDGKRQPEGEVLDAYLALTDGSPTVITDPTGRSGDAYLYRLSSSS